ncbi:hypothetical protein KJ840_03885 [Patescibacteria group bacterium]|nr:hypothetical protein [Patescibacteria group bacterium]
MADFSSPTQLARQNAKQKRTKSREQRDYDQQMAKGAQRSAAMFQRPAPLNEALAAGDQRSQEINTPAEKSNAGRSLAKQRLQSNAVKNRYADKLGLAKGLQDPKVMAEIASQKVFLAAVFKLLWSWLLFLPALIALHIYCFVSAVTRKKIFGEMSLVQILQFLGVTALVGAALLVIFFIVMVILDIYEHPFKNLKNLMEMAL